MNVYLVSDNFGKTPFLNKTMICSVMLFRYFTCLIEIPTDIFFLFVITIG